MWGRVFCLTIVWMISSLLCCFTWSFAIFPKMENICMPVTLSRQLMFLNSASKLQFKCQQASIYQIADDHTLRQRRWWWWRLFSEAHYESLAELAGAWTATTNRTASAAIMLTRTNRCKVKFHLLGRLAIITAELALRFHGNQNKWLRWLLDK